MNLAQVTDYSLQIMAEIPPAYPYHWGRGGWGGSFSHTVAPFGYHGHLCASMTGPGNCPHHGISPALPACGPQLNTQHESHGTRLPRTCLEVPGARGVSHPFQSPTKPPPSWTTSTPRHASQVAETSLSSLSLPDTLFSLDRRLQFECPLSGDPVQPKRHTAHKAPKGAQYTCMLALSCLMFLEI